MIKMTVLREESEQVIKPKWLNSAIGVLSSFLLEINKFNIKYLATTHQLSFKMSKGK